MNFDLRPILKIKVHQGAQPCLFSSMTKIRLSGIKKLIADC